MKTAKDIDDFLWEHGRQQEDDIEYTVLLRVRELCIKYASIKCKEQREICLSTARRDFEKYHYLRAEGILNAPEPE